MSVIHGGDVYCPRCRSSRVGVDFTHSDHFWHCEDCKHDWRWDHDGVDWIWPEDTKPTAGCPWCGTQNIAYAALAGDDLNGRWRCLRELCDQRWVGRFTLYDYRETGGMRYFRWTIRIPVRDVPFRIV